MKDLKPHLRVPPAPTSSARHLRLARLPKNAPVEAEELKKDMNINPDYFVAVVEDPNPKQLKQIRSEIRRLLY
jgi:hypothetical protein